MMPGVAVRVVSIDNCFILIILTPFMHIIIIQQYCEVYEYRNISAMNFIDFSYLYFHSVGLHNAGKVKYGSKL